MSISYLGILVKRCLRNCTPGYYSNESIDCKRQNNYNQDEDYEDGYSEDKNAGYNRDYTDDKDTDYNDGHHTHNPQLPIRKDTLCLT